MADDASPKPKKDDFYEFNPFRVPKYKIKFENAYRLSDVPGYVWYTPALLYMWGRFCETNLSDIVRRLNLPVFWYRFERPLFQGLTVGADSSWNHLLWAAPEDKWQDFVDALLETVQFDIPNAMLYQYALMHSCIYDPLYADRKLLSPGSPVLQVQVFAVLSNKHQVAINKTETPIPSGLSAVTYKPDPIHVRAAKQLFSDRHLTRDKAFERYKQIMLFEQDTEHQCAVDKAIQQAKEKAKQQEAAKREKR